MTARAPKAAPRKLDGRTIAGRKAAAARAANGAGRTAARAAAPEVVRKPRRKAAVETPIEVMPIVEAPKKPRGRRKKIVEVTSAETEAAGHADEHAMADDHDIS